MLDGLSYCCSKEVPCCEWGLLLVLATLDDDKSSFDTQLHHLPFAPKNPRCENTMHTQKVLNHKISLFIEICLLL